MSKADEILHNIDFIEISKANIDIGEGESQTAIICIQAINGKVKELGWI